MAESVFLSIVVPVYNVALYIEQCIKSILQQDFSDYELIIVNDGTQDISIDLIRPLINGRENVMIIEKVNGGLSSARNAALPYIKGKFVWFIDSDDWIAQDALKTVHHLLKDDNCTLLKINFDKYHDSSGIYEPSIKEKKSYCLPIKVAYEKGYLFEISPWLYIHKSDILIQNNLNFREDISIHEDEFFCAELFSYAKTIRFCDESLYYYRIRSGSIMQSQKKEEKLFVLFQLILFYRKKHKDKLFHENFWAEQIYGKLQIFYNLYKNADQNLQRKFDPEFKALRRQWLHFSSNDIANVKIAKSIHNFSPRLYFWLFQ